MCLSLVESELDSLSSNAWLIMFDTVGIAVTHISSPDIGAYATFLVSDGLMMLIFSHVGEQIQ